MPKVKAKRQRSGRILRWLRRTRPVFMALWAAFIFWFMVSSAPRRLPGLRYTLDKLEEVEKRLVDLRFRWRGTLPPHPEVVIVAIDRPIISEFDLPAGALARSPALQAMSEDYRESWRHVVWSEALDILLKGGAKVVVFDVIFGRQSADVVRMRRVMLEVLERLEHPGWLPPFPTRYLDLEKISEIVGADTTRFRRMIQKHQEQLVLGMSFQERRNAGGTEEFQLIVPDPAVAPEDYENLLGNVLTFTDADQVHRHAYHRWTDNSGVFEVKGLESMAVRKFKGEAVEAPEGNFIRYYGPRETFPYVPLSSLFTGEAFATKLGKDIFRDKLVYLGATYELAHDDKVTPFGIMPGVEVHANLAGDLLTGALLRESSLTASLWLTAMMVVVPALMVFILRNALWQTLGILCFIGAYVAVCQVAFSQYHLVLPMMVGFFGPIVVGGAGVIYSFFLEQREKAHVRQVFNRFVSKRVAGIVLKNAEEIEQASRGEKRPVAILFSDIRSFTTWSEKAPPENLVGQLNEYFERMVAHVEETDGTVQKFIGDAILAAWGDTHSNGYAEDCRRAAAAVLKMRETLRELNVFWDARPDRITISIGMGINHGDVVVGEMGHPERREYTVLGDGVNFAARLESATKQFHTDCLIGEGVETLTREHFIYRHADFIRVKGKTKPVNVFFLISDRTVPPPTWLEDYHRARKLYLERQFTEAAELFHLVKGRIGGEDFLCDLYGQLCEKFLQTPPPPEWDGSRELTEK